MKKRVAGLLTLLCITFLMACETKRSEDSAEVAGEQNEATQNSGDEKDADFAVDAADGGLFEIQLSTMALTKATSLDVKKFAQKMVDDHTKANNELKALASEKGIALPDVLGEEKQKKYYDLERNEKKEDFDRKYIDQMVESHNAMVNKFEKEAENGKDVDVKSWAAGKLLALRHHLEEAQRIKEMLK